MQENGSPDEVRKDDRADDLAGQRGTGSGKDSPHSTTGTPPSSRQRQAARCNDDDQSVDHQVNDDKNASSASSATYTTQALKDVLSAALQLSGSISRQHSERSLQIVTDLLVSRFQMELLVDVMEQYDPPVYGRYSATNSWIPEPFLSFSLSLLLPIQLVLSLSVCV